MQHTQYSCIRKEAIAGYRCACMATAHFVVPLDFSLIPYLYQPARDSVFTLVLLLQYACSSWQRSSMVQARRSLSYEYACVLFSLDRSCCCCYLA